MTYNKNINVRQAIAMQTKLTLRVDNKLIIKAKKYSNETGKSLSQLVADYFAALEEKNEKQISVNKRKLGPTTKKLLGVLKDAAKVSEKDYYKHLEDKYL